MTPSRNIPDKAPSGLTKSLNKLRRYSPDKGFFFLLATIVLLAGLACYDFSPTVKLVLEGDIAPADIMADRTIVFEDIQSTKQKREEARKMQPLICDLVLAPVDSLRTQLQDLFIDINQNDTPTDKSMAIIRLSRMTGLEITPEIMTALSKPEIQDTILNELVPFLQQQLTQGVLAEMRSVLPYKGGITIRNLTNGVETLRPDPESVLDIKSVETNLSQKLTTINLSSSNRRILGTVLSALIQPTLIPNYQATEKHSKLVMQEVSPSMYRLERGEIIVRQGEKVSRDQQIRIQTLWDKTAHRFNPQLFFGIIICGALLSTGLLFSPSGKPASKMFRRDYIFIALLLIVFSLISKGFYLLGLQLASASTTFNADCLSYAVPVAGAASLASLIFSARRYLVTGLLLAFFCGIMNNSENGLFLFYFLSAMWGTWVTSRTQNRQDAIWSGLPIAAGLYAMWLGTTLLEGGDAGRFFPEAMSVGTSILISVILTVALAPLIEMIFGYTTRFRLMELLNMEQPILRDLMLNAPGTYHHSLIVSNMAEAGSEAVGAHGLLCKVAALYHDIGKISKANYFIENQFTEENPHDHLTPSMSALILISHAKHGADLAVKHRLGKEVADIIRQHHGTGLIRYFYQKALQQKDGPPPKIEDFCYPGPRPQTKEAAIVMLADVVEASSRTLQDPNPARLRQHIDTIIKKFHSDGQLDESDLTFRDLDKLAESFQKILRGIFHHRIVYPEKMTKKTAPQTYKSPQTEKNATSVVEKNSRQNVPTQ